MVAYLGAAIVMGIGSIGPALGQGMVASKALESMGKFPEMAKPIRATMIMALGIIETNSVYAFVIAIALLIAT